MSSNHTLLPPIDWIRKGDFMITNDDILNMNFYKKEKFTGSYLGMRYLIKKDSEPEAEAAPADGEEASEPKMMDVFRATIWPGPYNYATTPEEQKTCKTFPFTPKGKQQVVDWLNEQWTSRQDEWPQ